MRATPSASTPTTCTPAAWTSSSPSRIQSITEREEKAAACAANAPFSEWGHTFTDPRLAAAVVDRLTFRGHIIATGTNSYRLRATRAAKKRAPTD